MTALYKAGGLLFLKKNLMCVSGLRPTSDLLEEEEPQLQRRNGP